MSKSILVCLALTIGATLVLADARQDCLQDKGDQDRAIADYTKAIEINPRFADAYDGRGWVYMTKYWAYETKHNLDRAIADYTKAIEINSQHAAAYFDRGYAYAIKGDHERADAFQPGKGLHTQGLRRARHR